MPIPEAFTLEQAAFVSGASERELRQWDTADVLAPSLLRAKPGTPYGRIYTFRDLVIASALAVLQRQFALVSHELRAFSERVRLSGDASWTELSLSIEGGSLWLQDAQGRLPITSASPETVVPPFTNMAEIARAMEKRASALMGRNEEDLGRITSNRYVLGSRPVIAGTRIATEAIWDFFTAGYDVEQIIEEYPRLTRLDVERAIAFEAKRRQLKQAS